MAAVEVSSITVQILRDGQRHGEPLARSGGTSINRRDSPAAFVVFNWSSVNGNLVAPSSSLNLVLRKGEVNETVVMPHLMAQTHCRG